MEALVYPTTDELQKADAAYKGFPSFEDWAGLVLEEDLWLRYRERLQARRDATTAKQFGEAVQVAVREAAVDTGAIEGLYEVDRGFTYSVATETAAWQLAAAEKGADVQALIQAQLEAYEAVLDVATKTMPVSEAWIRALHKTLTANQSTYRVLTPSGWQDQDLPKGKYKTQQNHPWRGEKLAKAYAPVIDTPVEMHRLVEQLRRSDFAAAHPVLQAAFAHYALVSIHPFADGNGRVARALASVYLYRSDSIPLVVYADQTSTYIRALEEADRGRLRAFADFVFDRGISAIARVTELLRTAAAPDRGGSLERLRELTTSVGGLTYPELDTIAQRLMQLIAEEVRSQLAELPLPATVISEAVSNAAPRDPGGVPSYRRPIRPRPSMAGFRLASSAPASGAVQQQFDVLVAVPPRQRATFIVRRVGTEHVLEASLADVHPEVVEDIRYRFKLMLQVAIDEALADLSRQAEESLRAGGYL